jgi:hypothetical protein
VRLRRLAARIVDVGAMAGVAAAIWLLWNPVLRYVPGGLAADVDRVLGWLGLPGGSVAWLSWLGDVEWLVAVVLVVALFWVTEKAVAAVQRRLDGLP